VEAARVAASNKKLGMWLFIISDSLTFAALLIGYCYLRLGSDRWPTPFGRASIAYTSLMTVCLLASSFTMVRAVSAARGGYRARMLRWLGPTIAGGLAFLLLLLNVWRRLACEGLTPRTIPESWGDASQAFGAAFYGITGLHMLHVLSGVVLLGVTALRRSGTVEDVEISGLYWQFVDVVWVFVFVLIYLL
jgi:cytochrome c oxidase subunit 3